jgi:DNA polymerase-3 subunit gamma/tau
LAGDISKILNIFNEVLEKGFDGHNFIAGLNSHFRDLLVSKDDITLKLLEATSAIRQRYQAQAKSCDTAFLIRSLETGSSCDLSYKNSKNQRLHVELSLLKLCTLNSRDQAGDEKKKPEQAALKNEAPVTPKTGIRSAESRAVINPAPGDGRKIIDDSSGRISGEKPEPESRSFSIKDIMADESLAYSDKKSRTEETGEQRHQGSKSGTELTADTFKGAWEQFINDIRPDGVRVTSMFKSVRTEVHPDKTITLHLSNAAQCDIFLKSYKLRLISFLERIFGPAVVNIEAVVDTAETEGIIYSDEQKYNHLVSRFPGLKDIRKAFNLDFE